jgi:hypothetical protein
MLGTLLRIAIISVFLATYELYFKQLYEQYLSSQGQSYGFHFAVLGYFIVLSLAYVVSHILVRRYENGG